MKIIKYEHACVIVEENNRTIIIDPGSLAILPVLKNVDAIIITHIHGDHLDKSHLHKVIDSNPSVTIISHTEVLDQLTDISCQKEVIDRGSHCTAGKFILDFYGHYHAVINKLSPCHNVGVMVNESFYYPGDSFTVPEKPVFILALPVSGPWMKTGEAMDFVDLLKPKKVFPTHNELLSEFGAEVTYNWLKQATENVGAEWRSLRTGESFII